MFTRVKNSWVHLVNLLVQTLGLQYHLYGLLHACFDDVIKDYVVFMRIKWILLPFEKWSLRTFFNITVVMIHLVRCFLNLYIILRLFPIAFTLVDVDIIRLANLHFSRVVEFHENALPDVKKFWAGSIYNQKTANNVKNWHLTLKSCLWVSEI